MSGALDVLLDEHPGVAEVVLPQALHRVERFTQFCGAAAHAHADPAAACRAFQHHWVANGFGGAQRIFEAVEQFSAFEHRYAVLLGECAGGVLEAKHAQLFWRWADEGNALVFASLSEGGVFRKEAVTGMDRLGAAGFGDGKNFIHRQISAGRAAFAEAMGFVGLKNMQAGGVSFGVDRHTLDL